mmetsp:Transcript_20064/g.26631  ORF Transcript_20064/g.26631 Transcript_20064/m.26631 type:complete len:246 (-) Transcript_20064:393-1130(-)
MSSYFEQAANEILGATERVAAAVEEGASILFSAASSSSSSSGGEKANIDTDDLMMGEEEDIAMDGFGGSTLEGIADGVLSDIMSAQSGPQTPWEHFEAFRHAINWSEPLVRYLLIFHAILFLLTIYTVSKRASFHSRIILLVFLFLLVRSAEYLNAYGNDHWEDFATQNYFDKGGIFIGLLFSCPLLLNCLIMLVCYMREAGSLLVEVKKMEMVAKKKKKNKDKGEAQSSSSRGKTNKKKTTKKD